MVGAEAIVAVRLSQQAADRVRDYWTWAILFDEAFAAIAAYVEANPKPDGRDHRPPSMLDPEKYKHCVLFDYGQFQFAYTMDSPEQVTIVAIALTWLQSRMM